MIVETQCERCRHLNRLADGRPLFVCEAFPDGVPSIMLRGDVERRQPPADHRQPFPGDGGIRFEAAPGTRHPLDAV